MLFKSNTRSNVIEPDDLQAEIRKMQEEMQRGNLKIRGNTQKLQPVAAEIVNGINKMLDTMQDSMEHIITRFELVNKTTNVGLWDMDVIEGDPVNPNNRFAWTDEFRHMLGYSDESDFPNVLSSWSDKLHPDDHDWVLEAFARHLTDYSGRTPYTWIIDLS